MIHKRPILAATAVTSAIVIAFGGQTREDGFNFLGQHWDIAPFSGSGQTPRYTPYIFQWASLPNYYLAEQASSAGQALWSLGVGSEIIVNGRILHVPKIATKNASKKKHNIER